MVYRDIWSMKAAQAMDITDTMDRTAHRDIESQKQGGSKSETLL